MSLAAILNCLRKMSRDDTFESLPARFQALPALHHSIGALKDSAASYLGQYRRHQQRAVSRGLVPRTKLTTNDAESLEHPPIEHEDSDEMLSSRLQYTRNKSLETLSELHGNVSGVLNTLSAQRWPVWVRSGLLSVLASAILAILLKRIRSSGESLLRFPPAFLQSWLPLVPYPIAAFFVGLHERRISCTKAASAKITGLITAVESSESVSQGDIDWISAEHWDGVN